MVVVFKVKALYDFEAKEEDDLGFSGGQIIEVTEEVDDNWLEGRYTDSEGAIQSGIFPREFVERYEPPLPARPTRPTRRPEASAAAASDLRPVDDEDELDLPPVPAASKPIAPPETKFPPSAASANEPATPVNEDVSAPPPAPQPAAAEPVASAPTTKKPPPPVAAKSNAFKDRIAAFNQGGAAPIAPVQAGKPRANDFIKKPFVAPPPSASSYVPIPRAEPVHKPYNREDDPEIRQRVDEDRAAAEAAGLAGDVQPDNEEDVPKPTSLKDRIARLQQQQMEQAQRRAEPATKKDRKPPTKKTEISEPDVEPEDDAEDQEDNGTQVLERKSLDIARDITRLPSAQRRPTEPIPPAVPEHDLVSDGNDADQSAAGETTDDTGTIGPEDSDDTSAPPLPTPRAEGAPRHESDVGDEEDTTETGEDVEEDELDEETRRRMALRERMAKMSGGMGMPGMFGGGMPLPGVAVPKRASNKSGEESATTSPPPPMQRLSTVPGVARVHSSERDSLGVEEHDQDPQSNSGQKRSHGEERNAPPSAPQDLRRPPPPPQEQPAPPRRSLTSERGPPSVPGHATPRPSSELRRVPPPPGSMLSPGPGSESDDEASMHAASGTDTSSSVPSRTNTGGNVPPVPSRELPQRSALSPDASKRASNVIGPIETITSVTDKRASRPPPPVPGSPPVSSRPPPPPPPGGAPPGRQGTGIGLVEDDDEVESGNEGDYDTDIASSAKHKDALKAHTRGESLDDASTTADESTISAQVLPQPSIARAVPPPPATQGPPRKSMDLSRAPPPVPSRAEDYDPYRTNDARSPPSVPTVGTAATSSALSQTAEGSSEDDLPPPPIRQSTDLGRPPPPPPSAAMHDATLTIRDGRKSFEARKSLDVNRAMGGQNSSDQARTSFDSSFIAADIPLNPETKWWIASQPLPPSLQSRRGVDILTENDESTSRLRGRQSIVTKNVYILFADYSETSISAKYDASKPEECDIQQSHKPSPPRLRQDQLEGYWQKFGKAIGEKAAALAHAGSRKEASTVGDGTPTALVCDLIESNPDALAPIGTKSFGALVYANLGNASVQQFDEIRTGDIVSLRSAKFEGHHGAMKTKYRQEYTSHVAVVDEWDGTKKAIRIFEQGRETLEGKKDKRAGIKSDKLRLTDLRTGEVRVWRVVGRDWVGWVDAP